ncbi:MAG: CoA-binding protein [Desulfurococcales archaeon]|nr:CoA-binding protein [Desulfurococcales archaeon]
MSSRNSLYELTRGIKSVAVVGASATPGKVGNVLLKNIIEFGFKGKIFPVNPKRSEILGLKAYASLKDLPETPDLVVIAVPAKVVPQVLRDTKEVGCGLAIVVTAGFKEAGNEEAQRALEEVIRDGKVRVIGPNSAGVSFTDQRLHASIEVMPEPGSVGLAMQSGAMGGVVISRLRELSAGTSFFFSIGNAADVGVEELFDYALRDEGTESMIAYIEWVKDGKEFIEKGFELSLRKPLCILKGGKGEKSMKAVSSHTGGLAGSYATFKAAAKKIGAYLADDVDDLVEVCEILRRVGDVEARKVLIASNSGGLGIVTASQLEGLNVELPTIDPSLKRKIMEAAGKAFSGSNPIDFGGDSFMNQVVKTFTVEGIENTYDLGILVYVPTAAESASDMASAIEEVGKDFRIPVIAYFDGEGAREAAQRVSKIIPVVTTSRNVGKAVKSLLERHEFLKVYR